MSIHPCIAKIKVKPGMEAHVKSDHYRRIGRQLGPLMDGAPSVVRLTAPEAVPVQP